MTQTSSKSEEPAIDQDAAANVAGGCSDGCGAIGDAVGAVSGPAGFVTKVACELLTGGPTDISGRQVSEIVGA
jgi:hypothetical protein